MDVENFCVFYVLYNILDFLYIFFSRILMTHLASCCLVFKNLPQCLALSWPLPFAYVRCPRLCLVPVEFLVECFVFCVFFSDSKSVFVKMKGAGVGCAEEKLGG